MVTERPSLEDRIDQRFVLLDKRGRRLFPYRELSPAGRYAFAIGTGHSGGRAAGQEVFFDSVEDALAEALQNNKPIAVRPIEPGGSVEKFLIFGPRAQGYEISREFLNLCAIAARPPMAVLTPERALELRAKRFALREVRPEQAHFRSIVFVAFNAKCAITGCGADIALDAAHKSDRAWRDGDNQASDGWLLRKDLHALYDAGLLKIDEDGTVSLSADAATQAHYSRLHGRRAFVPVSDH